MSLPTGTLSTSAAAPHDLQAYIAACRDKVVAHDGNLVPTHTIPAGSSFTPNQLVLSNAAVRPSTNVGIPHDQSFVRNTEISPVTSSIQEVVMTFGPDGSGSVKYPPPDPNYFVFDPLTGYRYDAKTGLHYDANTGYFFNNKLKIILSWDFFKETYLRVQYPLITFPVLRNQRQTLDNQHGSPSPTRSPPHKSRRSREILRKDEHYISISSNRLSASQVSSSRKTETLDNQHGPPSPTRSPPHKSRRSREILRKDEHYISKSSNRLSVSPVSSRKTDHRRSSGSRNDGRRPRSPQADGSDSFSPCPSSRKIDGLSRNPDSKRRRPASRSRLRWRSRPYSRSPSSGPSRRSKSSDNYRRRRVSRPPLQRCLTQRSTDSKKEDRRRRSTPDPNASPLVPLLCVPSKSKWESDEDKSESPHTLITLNEHSKKGEHKARVGSRCHQISTVDASSDDNASRSNRPSVSPVSTSRKRNGRRKSSGPDNDKIRHISPQTDSSGSSPFLSSRKRHSLSRSRNSKGRRPAPRSRQAWQSRSKSPPSSPGPSSRKRGYRNRTRSPGNDRRHRVSRSPFRRSRTRGSIDRNEEQHRRRRSTPDSEDSPSLKVLSGSEGSDETNSVHDLSGLPIVKDKVGDEKDRGETVIEEWLEALLADDEDSNYMNQNGEPVSEQEEVQRRDSSCSSKVPSADEGQKIKSSSSMPNNPQNSKLTQGILKNRDDSVNLVDLTSDDDKTQPSLKMQDCSTGDVSKNRVSCDDAISDLYQDLVVDIQPPGDTHYQSPQGNVRPLEPSHSARCTQNNEEDSVNVVDLTSDDEGIQPVLKSQVSAADDVTDNRVASDTDPLADLYHKEPTCFVHVKPSSFIRAVDDELLKQHLLVNNVEYEKITRYFQYSIGCSFEFFEVTFKYITEAAQWFLKTNRKIRFQHAQGVTSDDYFLYFAERCWDCENCNMATNVFFRTLCHNCYCHRSGFFTSVKFSDVPTRLLAFCKMPYSTDVNSVMEKLPGVIQTSNFISVGIVEDPHEICCSGVVIVEMPDVQQAISIFETASVTPEVLRFVIEMSTRSDATIFGYNNDGECRREFYNPDPCVDSFQPQCHLVPQNDVVISHELPPHAHFIQTNNCTVGLQPQNVECDEIYIQPDLYPNSSSALNNYRNRVHGDPDPMSDLYPSKPSCVVHVKSSGQKYDKSIIAASLQGHLFNNGIEFLNISVQCVNEYGCPYHLVEVAFESTTPAEQWFLKTNRRITLQRTHEITADHFLYYCGGPLWGCPNCHTKNIFFRSLCHGCLGNRDGLYTTVTFSDLPTRFLAFCRMSYLTDIATVMQRLPMKKIRKCQYMSIGIVEDPAMKCSVGIVIIELPNIEEVKLLKQKVGCIPNVVLRYVNLAPHSDVVLHPFNFFPPQYHPRSPPIPTTSPPLPSESLVPIPLPHQPSPSSVTTFNLRNKRRNRKMM